MCVSVRCRSSHPWRGNGICCRAYSIPRKLVKIGQHTCKCERGVSAIRPRGRGASLCPGARVLTAHPGCGHVRPSGPQPLELRRLALAPPVLLVTHPPLTGSVCMCVRVRMPTCVGHPGTGAQRVSTGQPTCCPCPEAPWAGRVVAETAEPRARARRAPEGAACVQRDPFPEAAAQARGWAAPSW